MLVSQNKFAKIVGRSHTYIGKLVKSGVIELIDGRVDVEKAKIAIEKNKDPSRDSQREANEEKRKSNDLFEAIGSYPSMAEITPQEEEILRMEREEARRMAEDLKQKGADLPAVDTMEFLNMSSSQVRIFKEYYQGKISELDYLKKSGELITVEEVKKENEQILIAFRSRAMAIPTKLAPLMIGIENIAEAKSIMDDAMYELLLELSRLENI
ncbi:MAG: hypothetical protein PHV62_07520 [Sulfuricurvum sp.]|nr:hypothetical protein [Sulfuricurvum sp.]